MSIKGIEEFALNRDRNRYELFSQGGSEPTAEDLTAFERKVGFRFPDEFREFALHTLGGFYLVAREEIWPRAKLYEVGPFWSFLRGLQIYSLSTEAPDWLQMEPAWQQMSDAGYPGLVPFLKIVGSADPYCFTSEGKIVIWYHDDPDNPQPIEKTFGEVVLHEIAELDGRVDQKIAAASKPQS